MADCDRNFNAPYTGEYLNRVAFPLGGIGAGMVCLEGSGALSHVSVRNRPDVFNEPLMFAALCIKGGGGGGNVARVLEGPVPGWKIFGPAGTGNGGHGKNYGLPRMLNAKFSARFPFGSVGLDDARMPVAVGINAWSPFIPGNADDSSLPVAALEYTIRNPGADAVEVVFSFHARNFMVTDAGGAKVVGIDNGFVLYQPPAADKPHEEGAFGVCIDDPGAQVDCAWFRGGWFDTLTMLWQDISSGRVNRRQPVAEGESSPGGSVYLPFMLRPGEERTVRLLLGWHVPVTDIRLGKDLDELEGDDGSSSCCCAGGEKNKDRQTHKPWYAGKFSDVSAVMSYWQENYRRLRMETCKFSDCFYDTTLPPEVVEAVAANLTILKSPTVLRQADGKLWAWEGCCDGSGCCSGSCTHVWNYAQALPHLFPELERSLRRTEFYESQNQDGHQVFRAYLPIREAADHSMHAAADGQLGGIMKVYREWRISGDDAWLRAIWPRVRTSLAYCIETWDPEHAGVLVEPHHNTYDIEFWGPDGMCSSFYLGALKAAALMAAALGEDAGMYDELYCKGRAYLENKLFNGEYFFQDVRWQGLRAEDPVEFGNKGIQQNYSPEALEVLQREGPKYQYGTGCLADGVLGCWIAAVCGIEEEILEVGKVGQHLLSVYRHNLKRDLSEHANPQRPTYALGGEGGLLLCTWPNGGRLSLPFPYSEEVWTGFEYQVASHLIMLGRVREGLEIVRVARSRYDGRIRNPFNEYECGHWYARAMSSYGLLQALSGAVYDARSRVLKLRPRVSGDFRAFLCTATGFGTVGVRDGKPFCEVAGGEIPVERLDYTPCEAGETA